MTAAFCRRVEQVLVQDETDPTLVASMEQHLQSCHSCRRHQRTWETVRQSTLAANDVLDDLTRARVFGRVQARLAEGAVQRPTEGPVARPLRARFVWSLAFAAVLVLAFSLGGRLRKPEPVVARGPLPVALEPYALNVPTELRSSVSGKGLDRLELPPRASMRARLGPAADLTLLGPLELAVRDSDKQRVELELGRGTLVGDFDGSGGRSLRISTADAIVDIVGTRFLVEVGEKRTRVSVEHGLVRVESKGRVRMVGPGLSWRTDEDGMAPFDARTARLFERAAQGQWEALASEAQPTEASTQKVGEGAAKGDARKEPTRGVGLNRKAPARPTHLHRSSLPFGDARPAVALKTTGVRERTPPGMAPAGSSLAESAGSASRAPANAVAAPVASAAPVVASPPVASAPVAAAPRPSPAEAPPPPPAAKPPVPRGSTVSSLYKEAEQALRQGDDDAGKRRLAEVARSFPRDVMADSARFELALLAQKAGNQREALAQIREILSHGTSGPFVEPARFLRCRLYLDEDRDAAESCLVRFVRDYPQSPHDDVALRALTELARDKGQCSKARKLAETYLQRHPHGSFAADAGRVQSHCGE